jgi:hypothetical protein
VLLATITVARAEDAAPSRIDSITKLALDQGSGWINLA